MKEVYVAAEMEIIEFACEDIITNGLPFAPNTSALFDEFGNLLE